MRSKARFGFGVTGRRGLGFTTEQVPTLRMANSFPCK
jgi:hypothetical protein